jgi:hypothetical protein
MHWLSCGVDLLPVGVDEHIAPQPQFFGKQFAGTLRFPRVIGTQQCDVGGRCAVDAFL